MSTKNNVILAINSSWKDLQKYKISNNDIVIGITASGTTPYVLGGLLKCMENNKYLEFDFQVCYYFALY